MPAATKAQLATGWLCAKVSCCGRSGIVLRGLRFCAPRGEGFRVVVFGVVLGEDTTALPLLLDTGAAECGSAVFDEPKVALAPTGGLDDACSDMAA